jgi:hypothetical protein
MRRMGVTLAAAAMLAIGIAVPAAADDTRIVGGAPTTIDQFPWQVGLARSTTHNQFCGGTLVAPTIVITAAHCTFNFPVTPGFNAASNFEVFTGRTFRTGAEGQTIPVSELWYFEGTPSAPVLQAQSSDPSPTSGQLYNPFTDEWDAVFLQLASPSTTGTPIKIAGPGEEATWAAGQPAFVSGWGTLTEGGVQPDQLQAAQVPIVSDANCGAVYGADFFPATMVCAGFPQGGVDTCQGDSGGPMVVQAFQRSRAVNTVRLVGDTSFGTGCARPGIPGVYGRLAADPMRSTFRNGILQVAGVDVVGSGAVPPDSTPPVVDITKHPKKRETKNKAKFKFTANEEATFQCALDKGAFKPCSSPFKKHVSDKKHKFRVQATDVQGNVGAVDKFKWRVFG